jgi:hypothetical protein
MIPKNRQISGIQPLFWSGHYIPDGPYHRFRVENGEFFPALLYQPGSAQVAVPEGGLKISNCPNAS